jgi:hypothetical protein
MAIDFLEKEIKTYIALALFFSNDGIKERLLVGAKKVTINGSCYENLGCKSTTIGGA